MSQEKKQGFVTICNKEYLRFFFNALLTIGISNVASASVLDATISTGKGETRIVDLSNNVSGITDPIILIATAPAHGSATAITCERTGQQLCISYTPNDSFSGVDTFSISVLNDNNIQENATISVSVAGAVVASSGVVPDVAVRDTLDAICGSSQVMEVDTLCQSFNAVNATTGELPEDLRELLDALTPQDIAAQGTTGSVLAAQQLENIGKHLAALRRGQKNTSLGGLSFRKNKQVVPGSLLSEILSANEGVAQNTFGVNWGWFINGSLGGGKQDESDFENGFDFTTDGLSSGLDYRLGNLGVVGMAIGYGKTDLNVSLDQGGLDASGVSAVFYGSFYTSEKTYLDLIGSTNQYHFESTRRIIFGSTDAYAASINKSLASAISLAGGYEL
ncbi:MAG: autotransporter domain-containing protein, partial [Gammaproteobacteria bacterium]|nr:autotransporter domain-containing protein [Gammaproteobacteria bacterium]